ncbi:MAG: ATP-binding protein [Candidatus Electryonea clarkiae]|nr:ATP-binding protein [Candidatus Electryonea clarkiae]
MGVYSIFYAIYFVLTLIDRPVHMSILGKDLIFQYDNERSRIVFLSLVMNEQFYFALSAAFSLIYSILFLHDSNDTYITNIGDYSNSIIQYSSYSHLYSIFFIIGVSIIIYMLFYGYRINNDRIYRNFIRLNIISFFILYSSVLTLGVILPLFGIPTKLYSTSLFPLSVILFYVAILRYQFERADELNANLERKIEERTSELKDAYTLMVQSEKMASLGQFIAGIAHEINNPIAAVLASSQNIIICNDRIQASLKNSENVVTTNTEVQTIQKILNNSVSVVGEGAQRIANTVSKLKNFIKLDEANIQNVDVHQGLEEAVKLLEFEYRDRLEIVREFGLLPNLICNPRQLNQVWLNLLINAFEAQSEGDGIISITTSCNESAISVTITDQGDGIPDKFADKIFDPGFTTKNKGTGTGLGLAICYRIIQRHNGRIEVQTEEGNGASFTVYLPLDDSKPLKGRISENQ